MGGYERDAAPRGRPTHRRTTRSPPTSTAACCRRAGTASRRSPPTRQVRVPAMADVGLRKVINGPEAFTPDNEFCLGETEVDGFFVAAGFCAHGIAGAGGIGKVMAEWIVDGEPGMDVWHMDVRRFGRQYRSPSYTLERTLETYETYYDIIYPATNGRPAGRCGPRRPTGGTARTARLRREGRLGAGQPLRRATRTAGDESLRPTAGPGGLVAGDRRRAPGDPRDGRRCSTSRRSPRSMVTGPDAADAARVGLRQPRRPRGRRHHLHPGAQPARWHRVRLHGDPARRRRVPGRDRARRSGRTTCVAAPAGAPARRRRCASRT